MGVFLIFVTVTAISQLTDNAEITKWEGAIARLEQSNQLQPHVENSILFCGSSSIRLWNTIQQDMAPWPVIKRGYGGAKLPDVSHYAPRLIGPYLGAHNPKRCKAIVLFVANDISGEIKKDATPTEVGMRFARLHSWIRQLDPGIPVFWIEVTPTNNRWQAWPKIQSATQRIRDVLDPDPNGFFVPTAGAYLGIDGRPKAELFVDDQLHLNEEGYKLWAALIKTQLHQRLGAAVRTIGSAGK